MVLGFLLWFRRRSRQEVLVDLFPPFVLAAMLIVAGTIFTTLGMCKERGHTPDWMWLPQISLTGNKNPEKVLYALGFTASCIALFPAAIVLHSWVLRPLMDSGRSSALSRVTNYFALACALAAIFALFLQACVPLQENIAEMQGMYTVQEDLAFIGPADAQSTGESVLRLRGQTVFHIMCAFGFFFFAYLHCAIMLLYTRFCEALAIFRSRWWWVKCGLYLGLIGTSVLFSFVRVFCTKTVGYLLSSCAQWIAALCLIAFTASYALDVRKFSTRRYSYKSVVD